MTNNVELYKSTDRSDLFDTWAWYKKQIKHSYFENDQTGEETI